MAAADDKKKKQKTTESLDDAVKQLGLSKRAIHEVVRVATARAAELSGQRVGMDLLHALTRRIKSEEGQPSAEQVKEQCLYAMHECLMQIDAIGKASGKLCSQIETLAEKCTEHVPRTLIKARGSRAPIAEHLVKTRAELTVQECKRLMELMRLMSVNCSWQFSIPFYLLQFKLKNDQDGHF